MFSFIWDDLLVNPLLNLLVFLHNVIPGHDLGVAIIIITIVIRFLVVPLSIKASRSQRKMKQLMPELSLLKEQHKEDQQALARAQMEFYKRNGVSPFASCLPVLIQFPILIALYNVLREGLAQINPDQIYSFIYAPEKLNATFLGIVDLSVPEKYVLPILAGGLQYILGIMTTPIDNSKNAGPEAAMAKNMVFMLPLMTAFFALSLPSGISLYWVAGTLFSVLQQVYVNHEKGKEVTVKIKKQGGEDIIEISEGDVVVADSIPDEEEKPSN